MKKFFFFSLVIILLSAGVTGYWHISHRTEQKHSTTITFLDIGQGDATFIEFSDGQQMLVDCAIDARILEALGRVMPFYDFTLDYLVITHPDLDHYGGCVDVLKKLHVRHIVYSGLREEDSGYWNEFWFAIEKEKAMYHQMEEQQEWMVGDATLHFLYPDHSIPDNPHIPGHAGAMDKNNTSIVFVVDAYGIRTMLTGDMEEPLEKYLIETASAYLAAHILKAGHHGSGSSSSQSFLNLVQPEETVISAGENNPFHHPNERVLRRLKRMDARIWRTDRQGDIILTIEKGGMYVLSAKKR